MQSLCFSTKSVLKYSASSAENFIRNHRFINSIEFSSAACKALLHISIRSWGSWEFAKAKFSPPSDGASLFIPRSLRDLNMGISKCFNKKLVKFWNLVFLFHLWAEWNLWSGFRYQSWDHGMKLLMNFAESKTLSTALEIKTAWISRRESEFH